MVSFAAILLVDLSPNCACDFESVLRKEIGRDAASPCMVRHRNDRAILRDPRQIVFEVCGLNAEIHGEAAIRGHFIRPANIDDQNLFRLGDQGVKLGSGGDLRLRFGGLTGRGPCCAKATVVANNNVRINFFIGRRPLVF